MLTIGINSDTIRARVLLQTALKARFMANKELNTFIDEAESGMLPAETSEILVNDNYLTIVYDHEDVKGVILTAAEAKSKTLKIANIPDLSISDTPYITKVFDIPKAAIFVEAQKMTQLIAQSIDTENTPFEMYLIDENDSAAFDSLYASALKELCVEDIMYKSDTQVIYKGAFNSDSVNDIEAQLQNNIIAYLHNRVVSLFYSSMLIERKDNDEKALVAIQLIKKYLNTRLDSSILSQIIEAGIVEFEKALRPITRKLPTGIIVAGIADAKINFRIESNIVTSASLQLLKSLGLRIIVNTALSKWYTMCGITSDANEALRLQQSDIDTISLILDDRLRLDGAMNQIFTDAFKEIQHLIHRYPERVITNAMAIAGNPQIEELTLSSFPGIVNSSPGAWIITLGDSTFTINLIANDPDWYQKIVTALDGSNWAVTMGDYINYKLHFTSKIRQSFTAPSFSAEGTGITGEIDTLIVGQEPVSTPSIILTRCQVEQPPQTSADRIFVEELTRLLPEFIYLYILQEWYRISENSEFKNALEKIENVIKDIQYIFIRRLQMIGRL